ncbi:hypothetical protein DMENIID0001_145690 [Sergentomyia squamirostris]
MFSFHKPKVYRSTQGCCICKAKSSSSRFTDSKKYETDFINCFQLEAPRKGEICNACVLLVKRFKRLPVGSERHWGHVVDARVGPGLKSMTKFKKRKEESLQQQQQKLEVKEKESAADDGQRSNQRFCKIFKKNKKKKVTPNGGGSHGSSDDVSSPSSPLSYGSDGERAAAMGSFDNLKNFVTSEFTDGGFSNNSRFKISRRSLKFKRFCPVKNNKKVKGYGVDREALLAEGGQLAKVQACCGPMLEGVDASVVVFEANNSQCPQHRAREVGVSAMKKHHMYSKVRSPNLLVDCLNPMLCNQLSMPTVMPNVVLGSMNPAMMPKEYNFVKNIVKICNETKAPTTSKVKTLEKIISVTENLGNKFSDNSSDSGYEELPNVISESKNHLLLRNVGVIPLIGMNPIHTQPISPNAFKRTSPPGRIHTDRVETVIYARTGSSNAFK